jgi:hypothetical protein
MTNRIVSLTPRQPPDAASSYFRAVAATVMSKGAGRTPAAALVRRAWPDDDGADLLVKAASAPASMGVPSWAGVLSIAQHANLLNLLAPASAGAALLGRCIRLEWPAGVNSLSIPAIDSAPTKVPWMVEGSALGVQMFTTSLSVPLTPAKLAVLVVLSDEVLSYSTPSAETLVRLALSESLGLAIDTALLSSTAATASTPAGLFAGVAPLTASTSTIASEAMVEDIANVVAAVSTVAGNSPVVLLCALKQAAALKARLDVGQFDVLACPTLAPGTCLAVATNGLVSISDDVPEFSVSNESSLHMDSAAQPIGSAAPAKTMFQTQCVAIRLKMRATWILRDPRAVALITGCAW